MDYELALPIHLLDVDLAFEGILLDELRRSSDRRHRRDGRGGERALNRLQGGHRTLHDGRLQIKPARAALREEAAESRLLLRR